MTNFRTRFFHFPKRTQIGSFGRILAAIVCVTSTVFSFSSVALAIEQAHFEDPAQGRPFFPWLWKEQIKPTAREALDTDSLSIFLGTSAAVVVARQYDGDVRVDSGDHRRMPGELSAWGDFTGSGIPGAATAVALLVWDQPEGLKLSRTLLFTSATHLTIANLAGRRRPNDGLRSFPSGHTSTSFALAGSLAYSYGPWIGVPALAIATFVGASRIADNAHWFSDVVAGAGLGLFWARASAEADLEKGSVRPAPVGRWTPTPLPGGALLSFSREF